MCPTYDFDMSWEVANFIKETAFKNIIAKYIFGFFTCGKSCLFAEDTLKKIITEKGLTLTATYTVAMPDNYIPMFPLSSKEKQNQMLKDAEPVIDKIISNVKANNSASIDTPNHLK